MATPLATVSILSIGSMGLGVARLLQAHNFRVVTNLVGRSSATASRASSASITALPDDASIVAESDYILSILPPKDAITTAHRIVDALTSSPSLRSTSSPPLYYLDLNAVSPHTARSIAALFETHSPTVRFVDGGIIGSPPSLAQGAPAHDMSSWKRPSIPVSGPHRLDDDDGRGPASGARLAEVLRMRHIDERIGTASGLKCSFAAMTKGLAALTLQSFTTAAALGVLPELQEIMREHNPRTLEFASRTLPNVPGKAGRWVEEMREIGRCFADEGGWGARAEILAQVARVYEVMDEVVGARGGTEGMDGVEEVANALGEGLTDDAAGREEEDR